MTFQTYIKPILFTAFAATALFLTSPGFAYSQVYKWVDDQGNVQYSDQPRDLKTDPAEMGERIIPARETEKISPAEYYGFEEEKEPEEVKLAQNQAEAADDNTSPGAKAIVMVGELTMQPSMSGRAMITATIKNQFNQPVAGIRLDVILFKKDRTRMADLAIPFEGGGKRLDQLDPGETGYFEYETDLELEEIAGYKSRLVWAYSEIVAPPGEGEETPEGVQELIRSKKTGKIRKPGE